ncbi:MAG: DNA repair protein RecO [Pseudomonadales bacterium]
MNEPYGSLVMARIEDEPALVLHTRPYRESSVLVDLLTPHHGRVACLLKGGRNRLPVFSTFHATWYGGRELVTLATPNDVRSQWLQGEATSAGLYMNELIIRLVREREPLPELFAITCWGLSEFAQGSDLRPVLRSFEKLLLESLGYGLNYASELHGGAAIEADHWYRMVDAHGFVCAANPALTPQEVTRGFAYSGEQLLFSGRLLQNIADERFELGAVNAAAKRLFRRALAPLLGDRPLKSRELLSGFKEQAE